MSSGEPDAAVSNRCQHLDDVPGPFLHGVHRVDHAPDTMGAIYQPGDDIADGIGSGSQADSEATSRYFERWHRLPQSATENRQSADDMRRVAEALSRMYGREIRLVAGKLTLRELFEAVGAGGEEGHYDDVAETLRFLGPDSSAVVWSRWNNRPGASVFLALNVNGDVRYYDPVTQALAGWPPPWDQNRVLLTIVCFLDAQGAPLLPVAESYHCRLTVGFGPRWAQLSQADQLALSRRVVALNIDFAASMDMGLRPGSEQAGALAERHLDYARRLLADYGYESHRADARRIVTDVRFRRPLESIRPGLARYVRDIIVANAENHLAAPEQLVRD